MYELNEVSAKTIDKYCQENPKSSLTRFIRKSSYAPTISNDQGELHPWSTWPTVHRGVTNEKHKITHINQDISSSNEEYPAIWIDALEKGLSVGIWGSLQSYPPLGNKRVKFYVPDTFAPDTLAIPKKLRHLQGVNVYATKMGHGNAKLSGSRELRGKLGESIVRSILNGTFSKRSLVSAAHQIAREKVNDRWIYNRPTLQAQLNFDTYYKYLKHSKPDFTTFFTNHIASLQHRLWAYVHDKEGTQEEQIDYRKIFKAGMDEISREIGQLMRASKKYNYDVVLVSSMSQDAIKERCCSLCVTFQDFNRFRGFFSIPTKLSIQSSMFPDFSFSVADGDKEKYINIFLSLTDEIGKNIFTLKKSEGGDDKKNGTFFLSQNGDLEVEKGYLFVSGEKTDIKDIGMQVSRRLPGTAYHVPDGVLYWYSAEESGDLFITGLEKPISTEKIRKLLENHLTNTQTGNNKCV